MNDDNSLSGAEFCGLLAIGSLLGVALLAVLYGGGGMIEALAK